LKKLRLIERFREIQFEKAMRKTDLKMMQQAAREDGFAEGKEAGLEKGLEQGREEERKRSGERIMETAMETARKMKEWGDSAEKIAAVTGLSVEKIEALG
jgi:flagellar biosynthesis/type III secretory pathway protein FliH